MALENEIESLSGIKIGAAMETREILLYEQLQDVRNGIALELIPPALVDEFKSLVFPDRNLKWYAQALYKNRELHSKSVSDFLTAHMRASLTAGGYGQKLQQRGVRLEEVLMKMMQGM